MTGPKGDRGDRGDTGMMGVQGQKGEMGVQGGIHFHTFSYIFCISVPCNAQRNDI